MSQHAMGPDRFYTLAQRALQEDAGTRPLADRLADTIVTAELTPEHAAFIGTRDLFFLATVDARGVPTVSYKGGAPGFVEVVDARTLRFPDHDGNGMFLSLGNIEATGRIGMLFIDLERPHRVRVQATAVVEDQPHGEEVPGAPRMVQASIDAVFVNCGRYVHRYQRLEPSRFVPDADGRQPYPAWKRIDGFQDVLPAQDRGRAEHEGGTLTREQYLARVRDGRP
jgi:predicted pyridoxine 5'-phosphate oxidase superfamily flavin-nucleotide-binding protein